MNNRFNPHSVALETRQQEAIEAITRNARRGKKLGVNLVQELNRRKAAIPLPAVTGEYDDDDDNEDGE